MAITQFQKDNLNKGLGLFIEAIRFYIVGLMAKEFGDTWPADFAEALSPVQKGHWDDGLRNGTSAEKLIDFQYLKSFTIKHKHLLKDDFGRKSGNVPNLFDEIYTVRNSVAHYSDVEEDDATKAWINMTSIAKTLGMGELEEELSKLRNAKDEQELKTTVNSTTAQPWFRVVSPHLDIRSGRLDESVFAANLAEVALDRGNSVYSNSALFFSKTYVTQGLKTIAKRVIKGLNGNEDAENRVISLQTGFGGGKTHTLISLFHLARMGKKAENSADTADIIKATGIPEFDSANIAVFTNTTNDAATGRTTDDGIHIHTVWGELAYQLGGKAAYDIIKANDEQKVAPGGLFKKVLEHCKPALVLIDELADYCVKAGGIMVGKTSLADQTISFMQELTEAVAGTNNCVAVITLPASPQEVGNTPEAQAILSSLQKRVSRVGADTQPVTDDEIFEVIRRRLFDDIANDTAIQLAIAEYELMYNSMAGELPSQAHKGDYKKRMMKAYPFHPELIDIFRIRWASNHDFQRTRGVLRLLAAIVSDLWKRQQSLPGGNLLIHPSDINFSNLDALSGQLKKLEGNGYDAVITADVSGSSSNAFKIDSDTKEYGDWYLTQGISAVILMNTLGSDGANKGVSIADIKLQVLKPNGFTPHMVNSALQKLEETAHYLYYSTTGQRRYWFHTKPNINILINQTKGDVKPVDIESEIVKRLREQTNNLQLFGRAIVAPDDDIAEQQKPTLVILSPRYYANPDNVNGNTKPVIEKLALKRGNSDRIYRNTILFLVCSEVGYSRLQADVREYLACTKINADYGNQLEKDQKEDLKRKIEDAHKQVNQSLVSAYSLLIKHSAKNGVESIIAKEFALTIERQINDNLLELLKNEEWMLDSVGINTLKKNGLLPTSDTPVKVKDIYDAFIRYDDKPMVRNIDAVQRSIERYNNQGEFCVAAGDGKNFTEYYYKKNIPFFNVQDETYWLIDKSEVPIEQPVGSKSAPGSTATGQADAANNSNATPTSDDADNVTAAVIKALTVSGNIPFEYYTQIYSSFIQPLIHNDVQIEIKISGRSKPSKTITENSQEYKIIKESAKQLGLRLDEEK